MAKTFLRLYLVIWHSGSETQSHLELKWVIVGRKKAFEITRKDVNSDVKQVVSFAYYIFLKP